MEKVNKYYECLFVVDVSNGEEATKASVEKFVGIINANAEEVVEVAQWGKRRLAYPINDKPEGYYVVATFKCAPEFPSELERLLTIDENIMRQVTVRLDFVPVAKTTAPAEEPAAEAVAEEAAPVAEAAPAEEVAPAEEAAPADAQ
ncbi:MAG: 30S ribosomal protein S6 [Eubacteriales bacterium]